MRILVYDCAIGYVIFEVLNDDDSRRRWSLESVRLMEVIAFDPEGAATMSDSCAEHVASLVAAPRQPLPRLLRHWLKRRVNASADTVYTMHKQWAFVISHKFKLSCVCPPSIFSIFRFIRAHLGLILDEPLLKAFDAVKTAEMKRFTTHQIESRTKQGVQRLLQGHRLLESLKEQLRNATNDEADEAVQYRDKLAAFVSEHVDTLVPNLVEMVGPSVAVQLLARAGSLEALSKWTSSDLQMAGLEKKMAMAKAAGPGAGINLPCAGILFSAPVFDGIGNEHRKKLARTLASKAVLAIRIDLLSNKDEEHDTPRGVGRKFLGQLERKFAGGGEAEIGTGTVIDGVNYLQPKAAGKVRRYNQLNKAYAKKRNGTNSRSEDDNGQKRTRGGGEFL